MSPLSAVWRLAAVALSMGAALALASPIGAAPVGGPFVEFNGSWSGGGHIRLDGGKSENLQCKAYYSPRGDGLSLGVALRCASASNKIDLRAKLSSHGNQILGSWEERSYNASGSVVGVASGNRLQLTINGGGLAGGMTVTTNGMIQSILVHTTGATVKGANISLRRD
jgi:hypothetical protein